MNTLRMMVLVFGALGISSGSFIGAMQEQQEALLVRIDAGFNEIRKALARVGDDHVIQLAAIMDKLTSFESLMRAPQADQSLSFSVRLRME